MTALIAQMIDLRDMAASIAAAFGEQSVRSLIIRRKVVPAGQVMPITTYLEIQPNPVITLAMPSLRNVFGGDITIEADDFSVEGISRRYTMEELVGTATGYIVDGILDESKTQLISGIECDFVGIRTMNSLCWHLLLRRKPDKRR